MVESSSRKLTNPKTRGHVTQHFPNYKIVTLNIRITKLSL